MSLIDLFIDKARVSPARIVYPEGDDARIVVAAAKARALGIARPIVVGNADAVRQLAAANHVSMDGVALLQPDDARIDRYAGAYSALRGMDKNIARRLVKKPLAFACMMVRMGDADGMVGGIASATASVIQAATLTVGFQSGISTPSSFFVMILPEFLGEKDKPIVFADCAVNIAPTARQLADIAVATGFSAKALLGIDPAIAFLSFSTHGSASHPDCDKVIEAVRLAREMNAPFQVDGELQADAALIPRVAQKKVKASQVAGRANVLVFPDLDAGNIAYKLVQYLGGAKAIGPILQGFAKPVNDLSRGASVDDIVGVTAITSIRSHGEAT